jgi:hypothetical protein
VIGAPYDVTHDMIDHFKVLIWVLLFLDDLTLAALVNQIDMVLHGSASKIYSSPVCGVAAV